LIFRPCAVECTHLPKVRSSKAPAKLPGQIPGKLLDKLLPVFGTVLPALFESNDASANLPIRCGHDRIDISGGSRAGRFEQLNNSSADVVLILGHDWQIGHRNSSISCPRIERERNEGWRSLHSTVRGAQIPIPTACAMDGGWLSSRAEVLETSELSCGLSLVMLSVKRVASWLAREMET
jgi:hypothetical protein